MAKKYHDSKKGYLKSDGGMGLGNKANGMVSGMAPNFPQGLVWTNWPVPSYEDAYAADDTITGIDAQRRGDLIPKSDKPRKI